MLFKFKSRDLIFFYRQNQSLPTALEEEEERPIIPNVLLAGIPLLETILNLRNGNLTDKILDKTDFNISRVELVLREINGNSTILFKKQDKVKDVRNISFLHYSFC